MHSRASIPLRKPSQPFNVTSVRGSSNARSSAAPFTRTVYGSGEPEEEKIVFPIAGQAMIKSTVERNDPGHIYYNATFSNTGDLPALAIINDTRSTPIIENPEDFEMSIVRFDVSALTIPITVVDVVPVGDINPIAPGDLPSEFLYATLTFGGIDYTTNVVITPSASTVVYPLGAIYNFQKLLDDVNAAFAASFALIPGPPAGSNPPLFIWNPVTGLIDLYTDTNYQSTTIVPPLGAPAIEIWVSYALWNYLTGFNHFVNGYYRPDRKDIRIEVRQTTALVVPAIGSRTGFPYAISAYIGTVLKVQQEAQQTQNWNSTRSLLITSSLLPIIPEYVPTNFTANDNSVATATQRIVSDFLVPADTNVLESRNVFQYLPTAEFRMIDLMGKVPVTVIDLIMNWTDFSGRLFQLYLDPGASLSVKILFRRKGVSD